MPTTVTQAKRKPQRHNLPGARCALSTEARAIEEQAQCMLRSSSYRSVRHVLCDVRQRVLILRGRVPSFYMKQIAQTVVRDLLCDGFVIDNQVEVDRT